MEICPTGVYLWERAGGMAIVIQESLTAFRSTASEITGYKIMFNMLFSRDQLELLLLWSTWCSLQVSKKLQVASKLQANSCKQFTSKQLSLETIKNFTVQPLATYILSSFCSCTNLIAALKFACLNSFTPFLGWH